MTVTNGCVLFAVVALSFVGVAAADEPALKLGFMSDTHVTPKASSADNVRGAFRVFRAQGADAVIHCGDLANFHYPAAYALYRQAKEDAYAGSGKLPEFYYVYANHDALDPKSGKPMDLKRAFSDMRECLGESHPFLIERVFNGIPLIVFPESWTVAVKGKSEIEAKISAFETAHPGKPIVVVTHEPEKGTVQASDRWGFHWGIWEKHPQVVLFTGHSHGSLRNPRCVWQGAFTAVDCGTLWVWNDFLGGKMDRKGKVAYEVYVAEFWSKKIVLRRFDVRDGSEIDPDSPWTIPLPFDPKTAPYAVGKCKDREQPAAFPSGAQVAVRVTPKDGKEVVMVEFPETLSEDAVEKFRLVAECRDATGRWTPVATNEMFSSYYVRPSDRTGKHEYTYKSGALPSAEKFRLSVTPVGFYGTGGKPIVSAPD